MQPSQKRRKNRKPPAALPELRAPVEKQVSIASRTCKDHIRYRLVARDGRHYFDKVEIVGAEACGSGLSRFLKDKVEGRFLDEINLKELDDFYCRGGGKQSCYQAMAEILRDLHDILGTKSIADTRTHKGKA